MSRQQPSKGPIPDGPHMRSVLIRAPPSFEVPTPRPIKVSPKAVVVAPIVKSDPTTAPWKLSKSQLQPLPDGYPLERTHAYVESAAQVQNVAMNISECLRKESIAAVYDNNEAMALAETSEHVRLCIRLFASKKQTIVEIQRRSGCCFLFHQSAKAILCAAKGLKVQRLPTFTIPDSVKAQAAFEDYDDDDVKEGVEIATSLLKKDRYDSHLLGMESLVHLTKQTSTSTKAAHALFQGHVLDTILSLVQSWRLHKEDNATTAIPEMDKDYFVMMHRNALTVLANCLTSLENAGELEQVLTKQDELVADELLSVLIQELKNAEERPHDACQACKCLHSLLRISKKTKMRAVELGASKAVISAYNEGVCGHLMLEQEASSLQIEIDR